MGSAGRIGLLLGLLWSGMCLADPPPTPPPSTNPAAILNQQQQLQQYYQQRQKKPAAPVNPVIVTPTPGETGVAGLGASFVLRGVRVNHSGFLSTSDITAIVKPYLNKKVDFTDLQRIVDKINALYSAKGVVTARAILPPETIKDGVVHIELIEGRLGQIKLEGNARTRTSYIDSRINQKPGELVDVAALKQQLTFFNRTNNVQLKALLQPGASLGLTNILILAQEPPRAGLDLFAGNGGVDSTGRNQLGAVLRYNGLFGITDRLDAYVTSSRGDTDGYLSYTAPVDEQGGRLGLSYSRNQINIINGPYQALDITGHSWNSALNFSQPFIATENWLFSGAAALSKVHSVTDAAGVGISSSNINQFSLGFSLENTTASHIWSTTQTLARLHSDETVAGDNNFTLYNATLTWYQDLPSPYSILINSGWQWTPSDNLPSAELFQAGGIGSVRGYELGILSGPRGFYADFELHRQFRDGFDGYVFLDQAKVFAAYPSTAYISGLGAGIAWHHWEPFVLSLDLAKPLNTVIPSQDRWRIDFRLTYHWDIK
ncbi:MAG: ShlB/FhaC/HecB family hemolysin secretion/activation protein [Gammaproteobacteria bacterium]